LLQTVGKSIGKFDCWFLAVVFSKKKYDLNFKKYSCFAILFCMNQQDSNTAYAVDCGAPKSFGGPKK